MDSKERQKSHVTSFAKFQLTYTAQRVDESVRYGLRNIATSMAAELKGDPDLNYRHQIAWGLADRSLKEQSPHLRMILHELHHEVLLHAVAPKYMQLIEDGKMDYS